MTTDDSQRPTDEPLLRIDQVAERTGLTKRTLRYYEEIGLLPPPARTEGNYRLYTPADVARLRHICQYRDALGLTLAEISELIRTEEARDELRSRYHQATDPLTQRASLVAAEALTRRQLAVVDHKLDLLNQMRAGLRARLERYAALLAHLPTGDEGTEHE